MQETIRAITFDVGGTLIEPYPSVGHIYAEVAAQHGVSGISPALLNERFADAWRGLGEFNYSRNEWADLVDTTFAGLTPILPSRTFFPALYAYFARPQAWHVFEDVFPTLHALAARELKLGIVSNWDERLAPLLRQLNLYDYFDAVVISSEVGFCKPSRVIFEETAHKLGFQPSAILHVGDSVETDVQGARLAGFEALELKRNAPCAGDGQITSLLQIS